jgi:predicted dehydrogenase
MITSIASPAVTRRTFLSSAVIAGAAALPASRYSRVLGANDRVRVGIVGFSDRFRTSLLPAFLQHSKTLDFEIVALSDIWTARREEGKAHLEKQTGGTVAAVRNNDELYGRKDVDAVIISTADFQHAQHGVEAVHAGRDAYVEKPLAHTMQEACNIRQAVRDSDRIVQIGTQRRSSPLYQAAYDYIRSGKFGDIVSVLMTWNVNQPGRWRRPKLVAGLTEDQVDWNRYLLHLPAQPFDPRKFVEFRLFWPFSSGIPDQWMVHQIDTVHWFSGLPRPRSVVANGGNYLWHDGRKNWDTMTAVFDYGPLDDMSKGFQVVYSSRMTNDAGDVKELYYSNGGTLDLDKKTVSPEGGLSKRSADEMGMKPNLLPKLSLLDSASKAATNADTGGDPDTSANMRNWMDCVRSRKTPNANIDAGYSHSVALCMTIAAIQSGRRVTFDDSKQEVIIS